MNLLSCTVVMHCCRVSRGRSCKPRPFLHLLHALRLLQALRLLHILQALRLLHLLQALRLLRCHDWRMFTRVMPARKAGNDAARNNAEAPISAARASALCAELSRLVLQR
jgi:hypothetical protein